MKAIFGNEADIWAPGNGLLLNKSLEKVLERGTATIVPAFEGIKAGTGLHPILDEKALEEWKSKPVKDYMFWVLRPDVKDCQAPLGCWDSEDASSKPRNIAALHGRALGFGKDNKFRPAARFVWWVHLNAIYRGRHWQTDTDSAWLQEIKSATKYWGTQGKYIKEGSLRTFIRHLGQYLDEEIKDVVMKNGIPSADENDIEESLGLSLTLVTSTANGRGYEDDEE